MTGVMPATEKKNNRLGLVDVLKGVACAVIVLHHLSSYGPMVDFARPLAPDLMGFLYDYGRFAVQVFLVVAGYMAAASLAPEGLARFDNAWMLVGRRYVRLAVPYFVALTVAIFSAGMARQGQSADGVPGAASVSDVIVHMMMLQDLLGISALSAGAWYLAIDLQLFGLTVLILALGRALAKLSSAVTGTQWAIGLVAAACGVSLFWLNRRPELDVTAVYFYGSYGMGLLTYWAIHLKNVQARQALIVMLVVLGIAALAIEFRERIALALAVALLLILVMRSAATQAVLNSQPLGPLRYLGRISYSVFLIHYPLILLFNAFMTSVGSQNAWASAVAMLACFACSIALADQLYRRVESLPLSRLRFMLLAVPLFMATAIAP